MIYQELNCFFLKNRFGRNVFFDRNFMRFDANKLSGLYAFVSYAAPDLLAISELTAYGSQHGGLDAMVHVLKLHSLRINQNFFSTEMPFFLPKRVPFAGGEVCFARGELMWWNVKSDLFSRPKDHLHDESPLLESSIAKIGFSVNRFVNIEHSVAFEQSALRILFQPNGQFKEGTMQLVMTHLHHEKCETIAFKND